MRAESIAIALPLVSGLALVIGWALRVRGVESSLAALGAFCLALGVGVAALLSDSFAGLQRGLWPREAVDWLAIAAGVLTLMAAWQKRPAVIGGVSLLIGLLLGTLIVCRLLYGSVYLRPGHTAPASLAAIALAGTAVGACWHVELARTAARSIAESLTACIVGLGCAATLGMSGSFQYAMIALLATLGCAAAWAGARTWPWIGNIVMLMLLILGMAFAELSWPSLIALVAAIAILAGLGHVPASGLAPAHLRRVGLIAALLCVGLCVGWNTQKFLQDVKGNNASHGGYEAYK